MQMGEQLLNFTLFQLDWFLLLNKNKPLAFTINEEEEVLVTQNKKTTFMFSISGKSRISFLILYLPTVFIT